MSERLNTSLQMDEIHQLERLRDHRRRQRATKAEGRLPLGARVSDEVAALVGSWPFIIIQSVILAIWIALNVVGFIEHWDPYPFILLNLVLSFQAAYTAPIIMMSQNRQAEIDRSAAQHDYDVNLKAELEIELLHQKVDLLREREIGRLIETIQQLDQELRETRATSTKPTAK